MPRLKNKNKQEKYIYRDIFFYGTMNRGLSKTFKNAMEKVTNFVKFVLEHLVFPPPEINFHLDMDKKEHVG